MRKLLLPAIVILVVSAPRPALGALVEDWKGKSPTHNDVLLGVMGGLGIVDSTTGFSVLGSAAVKVIERGFIPDINDQVFVEFQAGPLFVSSGPVTNTGFMFSAHLRWEFFKDEMWSYYAVGGFGSIAATSTFRVYPRFGIGAVYAISELLSFRAELSHEFLGLGFQFQF